MTLSTTNTFSSADWEEYAICYDSLLHIRPYVDMLRSVAQEVMSGPRGVILDASCGTGNFEHVACEDARARNFKFVGIDASKEMLSRAKQKCAHLPFVSFFETDLNGPIHADVGTFAQVVSINTLYAVASPEKTLAEFHRVLQPGGRLLVVNPKHDYENGLILRDHCNGNQPVDFWKDAHASESREEMLIRVALGDDESVIQNMLAIARHNRLIARNHAFHFFKDGDLEVLLGKTGFSICQQSHTYAMQDSFIIAKKGACQ